MTFFLTVFTDIFFLKANVTKAFTSHVFQFQNIPLAWCASLACLARLNILESHLPLSPQFFLSASRNHLHEVNWIYRLCLLTMKQRPLYWYCYKGHQQKDHCALWHERDQLWILVQHFIRCANRILWLVSNTFHHLPRHMVLPLSYPTWKEEQSRRPPLQGWWGKSKRCLLL